MSSLRLRLAVDGTLGPVLWGAEATARGTMTPLSELGPTLHRLGWDAPAVGPHRSVLPVCEFPDGPLRQRVVVRQSPLLKVPAAPLPGPTLLAVMDRLEASLLRASDDGDVPTLIAQLIAAREGFELAPGISAMPDLLAGVLRHAQARQLVAQRHIRIELEERFGHSYARWLPLLEDSTPMLDALVDGHARLAFARHIGDHPADADGLRSALIDADATVSVDLPRLRTLNRAFEAHIDSGHPTLALGSKDTTVVVRLHEPHRDGDTRWPLQTCLRDADGTVHPLADLRAIGDVTAAGAAEAAATVLRLAPSLARAAVDASGLDWHLSTAEASRFISEDATALETAGVTVMLPRTWTKQRATLKVEVEDAAPEGTKTGGGVGMQAMASFRWAVAVGEVDLTEEEIAQIREAQSELVQLRGQWIRLDQNTVRAAEKFLQKFSAHTLGGPQATPRSQRAAGSQQAAGAHSNEGGALMAAAATAEIVRGGAGASEGAGASDGAESAIAVATWTAFFASIVSPEAEGLDIDISALARAERSTAPGEAPRHSITRLLPGGPGPVPGTSPETLAATLRPYQQQGLDWMWELHQVGMGGILADDMGLGKTMQVLALLCRDDQAPGPTLLVCPMSVVGAWQREAARWAPHLRVHVHHGADRIRDESFAHGAADIDLVITTYSLLDRDQRVLQQVPWHRVVFDEAQHIKNAGTAVTRAARALPARHRLALTGTPVENALADLHSLMEAVNPGLLGSAKGFHERIAEPIETEGDEAALSRLRIVTSPFILRRVKTDRSIIRDLPEKIEMTRTVNLTPEQAGLYEALVEQLMIEIDGADDKQRRSLVGATLTRLKQVCNHPAHYLGDGSSILDAEGEHRSGKLDMVDDILSTAFARGEKVLLFTQFTTFGHMLIPYWREAFGMDIPFLHGGVKKADRDQMVHDFQSTPDQPGAMLLSLRAGGTGLTLTAANHVVHLDRWWNPAVENQATDRAFRIGQTKNVQVRKLVSAGTIEERIDAVLQDKSALAELAVGSAGGQSGEGWIANLDDAALIQLLSLDRTQVHRS